MAMLNIKNMPDALYKKLQVRAKRERRSVAQEVTHLLSEALEASKPRSILQLQGLGKEQWTGSGARAAGAGCLGLIAQLEKGSVAAAQATDADCGES